MYYACAYQYYSNGEPNFESGRYVVHTCVTLQEAVLAAFKRARGLCAKGEFDEGLCSVAKDECAPGGSMSFVGAPLYWVRPKSSWLRRGVEIQKNERPSMRAVVIPESDFASYEAELKRGAARLP